MYMGMCVSEHVFVYVCVHMYMQMCVYMYVCVCTGIWKHTCMSMIILRFKYDDASM